MASVKQSFNAVVLHPGSDFGPRDIWQHLQIFSIATAAEGENASGRYLMGRVWRGQYTFYNALDRPPHNKELITWPNVSIVPRLTTLG